MKAIPILLLCCTFCLTHTEADAQVDTLRGRVPFFHYNYYDSNWCKSQVNQGELYFVAPVNVVNNALGYITPHTFGLRGYGRCTYGIELYASEVAVQMNMDSAMEIKGLAFGYNYEKPESWHHYGSHVLVDSNIYNTVDYIFNIYDGGMNRLWSDTVATTNLRIDHYMEAGFETTSRNVTNAYDQWICSNGQECGYEAPEYVGLCYVLFDTTLMVPETFYIGITSSTPINILHDTSLLITMLLESYVVVGYDSLTCMPYETRRYRIAQGKGDSIQYWADEECHYGVQTCLYPILVLPCGEVTGLRCQALGGAGTVAFVEWDAGVNDSAYEVSYGPEGTPAGEGTVFETTIPQFVHALDRNTHYDFYVRARCDLDTSVWTAWSEPLHVHLASMAISDAEEPFVWSLTPNPAHGSATVQCEVGMTSVEVLTVKGERIMLRDMAGEPTCTLDLAGLARGIYIVQVTTTQGTAARKLAVE